MSDWSRVWASPLYRGATLALVLSGLGTSMAAPQIVLFLSRELHAPLPLAGLLYLTNLTAPFAGFWIGRRSDLSGQRLSLFRLCTLAGVLGWAGIAMAEAVWVPFLLSAVLLAFAGAAVSQLFAALDDDLSHEAQGEGVVAVVRMALTGGWVVGPVLGAWLAASFGMRVMFWATVACNLMQLVPLTGVTPRPAKARQEKSALHLPPRAYLPLAIFTALYVLVYAGEPIKYGFLLIHMEENLHTPATLRGAVIGIQPLIELVLMPFSVALGRRFGIFPTLAAAAAMGMGANLCFVLWASTTGMFAGQILMGGVWGIYMVLGLLAAQRLLPGAVATASAIFMSANALASALGGLAGGLGVAAFGLPGVFWLPVGFAGLAVMGLIAMSFRRPGS